MIVNNAEVAYITFDATNSNKTDWFDMSRVLDSSYVDLQNGHDPFFSAAGYMNHFQYLHVLKYML